MDRALKFKKADVNATRLSVFSEFNWRTDLFALNSDVLFVVREKQVEVGLEWWLGARGEDEEVGLSIELSGGYAFDRSVATGRDRHEWDRTSLDIDDAWFIGLNVKFSEWMKE